MVLLFDFLQYSAAWGPSKGRLNHQTSYLAKANNLGQWIQVDFGNVAKVTKIGTQGRYNVGQWVTKYTVSYSIDGGYFQYQLHKPYSVPRVSSVNRLALVLVDIDFQESLFLKRSTRFP